MRPVCVGVRCIALLLVCTGITLSRTWNVGPGRTYTQPSQVSTLVAGGDTVLIDPATYADVCAWRANDLLLKGSGGRVLLDAEGLNLCEGKAIWVLKGRNTTVDSVEFANASCPDENGAGIRQEGPGLLVRRCSFHDNEDGILAGADSTSDITVEYSEFSRNGFGDGYSHNLYIGAVRAFTLRYSWSHLARVGHEVKSRAGNNYILYNRIMDEDSGDASRELDLPNAGLSVVVGNLFQKGTHAENSNTVGYGLEGISPGYGTTIYFGSNTLVNARDPMGPFLTLQPATHAVLWNNVFHGANEIVRNGSHEGSNNWVPVSHRGDDSLRNSTVGADPGLLDPGAYDYHLASGSACIDAGATPDSLLRPMYQYVHPCRFEPRPELAPLDIGAYEYEPVGLSEPRGRCGRCSRSRPRPNPFTDFTEIPGRSTARYVICDAAGRIVGGTTGGRIGRDLKPGVYLLLSRDEPGVWSRVAKLGQAARPRVQRRASDTP